MKLIQYLLFYIINHLINKIPIHSFRLFVYKVVGVKIGNGSSIHMHTYLNRFNIKIGNNSVVNRNCYLDGRGEIVIGNNVSISPNVQLITAYHDIDSYGFEYGTKNITIEEFVWIGTSAIILPGVTLGKGTIVGAGSVVTKSTEKMSVVAGNPAKLIRKRNSQLQYNCRWRPLFF